MTTNFLNKKKNQSYLVSENSPVYTSDQTWGGYVVDIAVLQQDMTQIIKPDAYIVNLSPLYLSYAGFKALFYSRGSHFSPTVNLSDVNRNPTGSGYVLNDHRIIQSFADCGCLNLTNSGINLGDKFNLLKMLVWSYETDLNISTDCWDTCTLMDFYDRIDGIKALTDLTGQCEVGIKCSLTLDEFFDQLKMQGMRMSYDFNPHDQYALPIDPKQVKRDKSDTEYLQFFDKDGVKIVMTDSNDFFHKSVLNNCSRPPLYPGLVTAVITANFHSTTPGVKDVQVRWPFIMNFISINDESIIANNSISVHNQTNAVNNDINDQSISNTSNSSNSTLFHDGTYPVYLNVSIPDNTSVKDSVTGKITYLINPTGTTTRSTDLQYNTVDFSISGNSFIPRNISIVNYNNIQTPIFTRYTAEKFSKIHYGQ